jgi:hypothetical protein
VDSFSDHHGDFDLTSAASAEPATEMSIGTDERRMHVRAYNYWCSLLDGRDYPSIEDLDPGNIQDFGPHSVLLDFTEGSGNPATAYIGTAVRQECGIGEEVRTIADVPSRSLLSRLTDHYMQIIANRAPVGFEAEFVNQRNNSICYRGILMPFSSDGDTIDFIYGVINWKTVDHPAAAANLVAALANEQPEAPAIEIAGIADDESASPAEAEEEPLELPEDVLDPTDEPLELTDAVEPAAVDPAETAEPAAIETDFGVEESFTPQAVEPVPVHSSWEDGPLHDEEVEIPEIVLDETAGLADRLCAARETAESVKAGEGRTRTALYQALALAYDFAVAAQASPDEYAELLEDSGVKAQARAPMTPIVKLVFGIDYDKARLTEFAAALSYAQRQQVASGAFQDFIEKQPGGLKALVAAERQARRPEPKADTKGEVARARLRSAPPISLADVPMQEEFAVIVTRRGADGTHEPVAIVDDEALVERAIRRAV